MGPATRERALLARPWWPCCLRERRPAWPCWPLAAPEAPLHAELKEGGRVSRVEKLLQDAVEETGEQVDQARKDLGRLELLDVVHPE